MLLRRCGRSSIQLPILSLALGEIPDEKAKDLEDSFFHTAIDLGYLFWDLTSIQRSPLAVKKAMDYINRNALRDRLILSGGIDPLENPLFRKGGKKGIRQQLDRILQEYSLDYLDIFFLADPQGDVPPYEGISAIENELHLGRILYAGLMNYNTSDSQGLMDLLADRHIPTLLHRSTYSMANREVEKTLDHLLTMTHSALAAASPLDISQEKKSQLMQIADQRKQDLNQLSLAWILRQPYVSTTLLAIDRIKDLNRLSKTMNRLDFSEDELQRMEDILAD